MRNALLAGDHLEACRQALAQAGRSAELPCGATIFVHPEALRHVDIAVENGFSWGGVTLTGKHVICNSDFEQLVLAAVGQLRTRDHVHLKERSQLVVPVRSVGNLTCRTLGKQVIVVRKTFLDVGISVAAAESTVSTTDAHLGLYSNPRRKAIAL